MPRAAARAGIRRVQARVPLTLALLVSIAGASQARAQSKLTIAPPTGVVNDFAHVLDAATIDRMTRVAEDVRNKSRGEIAVVTLSDIGQNAAADVALQIGREWKVGKIGNPGDPTRNAGAVILLVPKETSSDGRGKCFIATGQGTEGFITDATAGDICREATPAFASRDYCHGPRAGHAQNSAAFRERIRLHHRYGAGASGPGAHLAARESRNSSVRFPHHLLRCHVHSVEREPAGEAGAAEWMWRMSCGHSSCRCLRVAGRGAVGAVVAVSVAEALVEAAALEGSAEAVASAVVAVAPVGEIQSRDAGGSFRPCSAP